MRDAQLQAYAIYITGGEQASLLVELPAGEYSVEWVNTKTGAIDKQERIRPEGGERTLISPPCAEDVALRIKARRE